MEIAKLPSKKKLSNLKLAILIIGLPILVYVSYQVVQLILRASSDTQPSNVVISNLTTSSVTISWTTESKLSGSVIPIENEAEGKKEIDSRGTGSRFTHYVELSSLEPDTKYNFIIVSGNDRYTAEGRKEFTFTTAPISADTPTPNPIHGTVTGNSGDDVILFALLKDKSTYPVSATIPSGGNWIMDLSALRNVSDKALTTTSSSSNLVVMAVGGSSKGAIVEGVYSTIFDSNGKLIETNTLAITTNTDIYSYIPDVAKLVAYAEEDEEDEDEDEEEEEEDEEEEEEEPIEEEPIEEEEEEPVEEEKPIFVRAYRIVHQLKWIDLVSDTQAYDVTATLTGEESINITNLTDTGFTVLWVSENKETGTVNYGTTKTDLSSTAKDERDGLTTKGNYYVHSVDISLVQPETTYYYEVVSGDKTYDNDGAKHSVTTFATLSSPPSYESVTGKISNMPSHGEAIIVANITDIDGVGTTNTSLDISSVISENGSFALTISNSRSSDGSAYYEYTSGDNMNIDILTTFDTDTYTQNMANIEKDIVIDLKDISDYTEGNTGVKPLSDYGILGASDGTYVPTSSPTTTPTSTTTITGTSTPKTGLMDNVIYIIVVSSILILSGSIIYLTGVKKHKKKMSKIL